MIPSSLKSLLSSADLLPDPLGVGVFVRFTALQPASRLIFPVGEMKIARFMACRRHEPFWMIPEAGVRLGQTPAETQSLLVEMDDSTCVILIPLVDSTLRGALRGSGENGLELVAETGDPQVIARSMVGLFVAAGENPYALVAAAARSVAARLGSVRLRDREAAARLCGSIRLVYVGRILPACFARLGTPGIAELYRGWRSAQIADPR